MPQDKKPIKKNTGSAKARRSAARLAAVQALYQMRHNTQDAKSVLLEFSQRRIGFEIEGDLLVPADEELLSEIVLGLQKRWDDVDALVTKALAAGGREKVETLLDCILRAGAYELLARGQTDTGIIINDYLNATASFYDGGEPKLVNAILDKIAKAVRE